MTELDLIIDLHRLTDRQGPGSDAETRRAIDLARLPTAKPLAIADLGCGTGASTLTLARILNASITAIDAAEPFIARLRERAAEAGLADSIRAEVADMHALAFGDETLDVIWSEGAIYNIGFEHGLRAWRRFLKPEGVIAVSELTWTTDRRPDDVEAYWEREYPGIATASDKLAAVERAGYEPLAVFFLPPDCWERHYYQPVRAAIPSFLERHADTPSAQRIADAEHVEMDLYRDHGRWYAYALYIARRVDPMR